MAGWLLLEERVFFEDPLLDEPDVDFFVVDFLEVVVATVGTSRIDIIGLSLENAENQRQYACCLTIAGKPAELLGVGLRPLPSAGFHDAAAAADTPSGVSGKFGLYHWKMHRISVSTPAAQQ